MTLTTKALTEMVAETHADLVAEEARERDTLTGGRSLYRLFAGQRLVALVTTYNEDRVIGRYRANGGKQDVTRVERATFGFPSDICTIVA